MSQENLTVDGKKYDPEAFGSFAEAVRQHAASSKTIEAHKEKKESARNWLLQFMVENDHDKFKEDGYSCSVSHTLKEDIIPEKLKSERPDIYRDCEVTQIIIPASMLGEAAVQELVKDSRVTSETVFSSDVLQQKIEKDEVTPDDVATSIGIVMDRWTVRAKNGR